MGRPKGSKGGPGGVRSLIKVGQGSPSIQQESVRFSPEVAELPIPMSGETAMAIGVKGLAWIEAYKKHGTYLDAYMEVNPKSKRATSNGNASKYANKVIAAFGGRSQFWEAMGVSMGSIARVVETGMRAKIARQFVLVKTGEVITAEAQEDVPTQLVAAKLAAQILGVTKEGGGDMNLQVVVTNYAPSDAPPWGQGDTPHTSISEKWNRANGYANTVDVTPSHRSDPDYQDDI